MPFCAQLEPSKRCGGRIRARGFEVGDRLAQIVEGWILWKGNVHVLLKCELGQKVTEIDEKFFIRVSNTFEAGRIAAYG